MFQVIYNFSVFIFIFTFGGDARGVALRNCLSLAQLRPSLFRSFLLLQDFTCKLGISVASAPVSAWHFALLVLTFDRLISILRPLHYPLLMTTSRTWISVSLSWIVGILGVLLGTFSFKVTLHSLLYKKKNIPLSDPLLVSR